MLRVPGGGGVRESVYVHVTWSPAERLTLVVPVTTLVVKELQPVADVQEMSVTCQSSGTSSVNVQGGSPGRVSPRTCVNGAAETVCPALTSSEKTPPGLNERLPWNGKICVAAAGSETRFTTVIVPLRGGGET